MTTGLLIRPYGTSDTVEFEGYEDIVAHLDCQMCTVIPPREQFRDNGYEVYGDDEGALSSERVLSRMGSVWHGAPIFGNILIVGPVDDEGNTTSLPAEMIDVLARKAEIASLLPDEVFQHVAFD